MQKKKLDLLLQRVSALEAKLTSFWTGPGYATPAVPPAPATPPPAAPPAAAVPSAAPSAAPVRSGPPGLDVYAPANEGEDEDQEIAGATKGCPFLGREYLFSKVWCSSFSGFCKFPSRAVMFL